MDTSTLISMNIPTKMSRGFTLSEIMIALAISSILMAGVLTVMGTSKRTYALQTELAELNDNARFIMDELKNVIREAGYSGCQSVFNNPFWQAGDDLKNDLDIKNSPIKLPSDILTVEHFPQLKTDGILNEGDSTITLANNSILPQNNDSLTIKDCGTSVGQVYTANIVSSDIPSDPWAKVKVPILGSLWKNYIAPVDVFLGDLVNPGNRPRITYKVMFDEDVFTLFKCPGTINSDSNGDGDMCNDYTTVAQEAFRLIEGVQNLQVRYGIDTDNDTIPNRYDTNPNSPIGRIISVRFTLLMRTINKRNIGGPVNFTFNLDADPNLQYNPSDEKAHEEGYYHRLFTTTVLVRNSIYPITTNNNAVLPSSPPPVLPNSNSSGSSGFQ